MEAPESWLLPILHSSLCRSLAVSVTSQDHRRFLTAHPCVLIEALQDFPAPILVLAVPCDTVQIEQAFHGLRPQQVVPVSWLRGEQEAQGVSTPIGVTLAQVQPMPSSP